MTFLSTSTEHLAFEGGNKSKFCGMDSGIWKIITLLSLIVAFVALIIGIVAMDKANVPPPASAPPTSAPIISSVPRSCRDVTGRTGVYQIQPDPGQLAFNTYCDMDSAGGGWTLVASVHENNIYGKCTPGDKWSSEQGFSESIEGSRNWQSNNVFGRIDSLTNDDYKNIAYYSLNASNILLWHVPNEKRINEISGAAFLKYYTNNNFLQSHGGTMKNLFKTSVPLRTASGGLDPLLAIINSSTAETTSRVDSWYSYRYDGSSRSNNQISDGGGDMYDGGNRVSFKTQNTNYTQITYNAPYFLYADGVEVKSSTTYPFITLAWIGAGLGDAPSNVQYFEYMVVSNYGADGRGNYSTYRTQTITQNTMTARFTAFNVFNANDPSVCEVFFSISDTRWSSTPPSGLERINWSNTTRDARNILRFNGSPKNVLLGYALLSKNSGVLVTVPEIRAVITQYMTAADSFTFRVQVPHIATSIKYALGNNTTIMNGIPLNHRVNVEPGYIQFRAFNSVGLPNALCPGVKVNSDNPERMCIGGISTASRDRGQCGDFAGWAGEPGDRSTSSEPTNTGKSLTDINSSILIFTR